MMNFEDYVADRWKRDPLGQGTPHDVPFPIVAALGLAGEVGEVVEHLKKHYRDGRHPGEALKLELGDVLHYLTVVAQSYGWDLQEIQRANMAKLDARKKT